MQAAIVVGLFLLVLLALSREWFPNEFTALGAVAILAATGVLTPAQTLRGFASPAVMTIAGVMLVTGAIVRNGVADAAAWRIQRLAADSERRFGILLLLAVNGLSAIINNVAATAIFVPVAEGMARRFGSPPSRYLMPVAFASMTGGVCTLIGTSTNIAASDGMERHGLDPLGLFELTPLGVAVAFGGMAYLLLLGPRLLRAPDAAGGPLEDAFLYEVEIRPGGSLDGSPDGLSRLQREQGLEVMAILRGGRPLVPPFDATLQAGDHLLVRGPSPRIQSVRSAPGISVRRLPARDRNPEQERLIEATISYGSPLIGRTLAQARFASRHRVVALAIRHRDDLRLEKVGHIPLSQGDVLLLYGDRRSLANLARDPAALLVERRVLPPRDPGKGRLSLLVLAVAIGTVSAGWLQPPAAFLAAAAAALALRCLPLAEARRHLNLRFLVLIAGLSTMGVAMEVSGAARFLAELVLAVAGHGGPRLLMALLFVLTVLMTQPLNNAAAALLMLPVCLEAAAGRGLDPRPFAIAITVAASCSFITPLEPACLLVYGTGHYRFRDFARVGLGLTVLLGAICLALIPWLWPIRAASIPTG